MVAVTSSKSKETQKTKKTLFPKKKASRTKYEIIGFDVETHGNENLFYLGGLYHDEDNFKYYFDKDEMIKDLLDKKYNNKLICATNLTFDFNALFFDTPYWSKFKIIQVNTSIIACIYQPSKHLKITFIDSMNYVPFSVKVMGEILGIPKLDSPKCLGRIPNNEKEKEELIIYNKRDCEVTKKFVDFIQDGFYNEFQGQLKLTIASTSMDIFQRKYLRFPLQHEINFLEESEKSFKDFLFSGYYGGHTETFARGKIENMFCYDINSLYPSVMVKNFPLPNSVVKIKKPDIDYFKYMGMSEVTVYCPHMKYPYLPLRKDKLLFPTGTFRGVYTHFELEKAIELGYKIIKVHRQYIYKKSFYPFRAFIMDLYSKRLKYKKENNPIELLYKLVMNSSYGKFAQKKSQDIKFIDLNEFSEDEKFNFATKKEVMKVYLNDEGKGFELDDVECESSFVIPIFSIYVTAYARDKIYQYVKNYDALYMDTDSIVTSKPIPESLELGYMKLEYDILEGILVKPKMYIYKTKDSKGNIKDVIKLKGVPTKTRETFFKILNGEIISYQKFSKVRESLRGGYKPNTIRQVTKLIGLEDSKRKWSKTFDPTVLEWSKPIEITEQ